MPRPVSGTVNAGAAHGAIASMLSVRLSIRRKPGGESKKTSMIPTGGYTPRVLACPPAGAFLCWNCGNPGQQIGSSYRFCCECDCFWTYFEELNPHYETIMRMAVEKSVCEDWKVPLVDFTKPGAP